MGRPIPVSLSPSKVESFKSCPLAFRFSVIDRLPEPPSPAASRGTLVHAALERLMVRPPEERTLDAALLDLDTARTELAEHPEFAGLGMTPDEWSTFHSEAASLVANYFLLENPTTVVPIGLELMMSAELGSVTLRGIIDRLELDDDGELVVTDYKTGRPPREGFEKSRLGGVEFYALLCEEMLGRRPARVQLMYLGEPEVIIRTPTAGTVRGVRQRAAAIWQAVQRACATDDFRPRPGPLCDWCNFRSYCPSYGGDPDRAVELRDGLYQERLPVA